MRYLREYNRYEEEQDFLRDIKEKVESHISDLIDRGFVVNASKNSSEWIFVGEDISDLDAYMQENHACKCEYCVKYKSFLDSPQSYEFRIEEINYEDI